MPPSLVVVVREDPAKSHRAVEALRIALGLSTGENPMTIVLLDQAPHLLTEEPESLVDGEILEKHLPVLRELEIPFVIPQGAKAQFELDPDVQVREASEQEIAALVKGADRVLVF